MLINPDSVRGFVIGVAVIAAAVSGGQMATAALPNEQITDPDQIAATFGVDVVWDITFCTRGEHPEKVMGCASASTPNTIYLNPDVSPERKHRTVLHELGHIVQYRLGLDRDECNADIFADSLQPPLMGFNC